MQARIAHTKQKPQPRLVSKAHRQEQVDDPLAFESVERAVARQEADRKRRRG